MSSQTDLYLIDGYTGGVNMPTAGQAGFAVRADVAGTSLDYVAPAQSLSASGSWDGQAESVLVFGSGARTIALPNADIIGRTVEIVDAAGNSASGTITIDPAGAGTINGAATATLTTNYQAKKFRYVAAGTWVRTGAS